MSPDGPSCARDLTGTSAIVAAATAIVANENQTPRLLDIDHLKKIYRTSSYARTLPDASALTGRRESRFIVLQFVANRGATAIQRTGRVVGLPRQLSHS